MKRLLIRVALREAERRNVELRDEIGASLLLFRRRGLVRDMRNYMHGHVTVVIDLSNFKVTDFHISQIPR